MASQETPLARLTGALSSTATDDKTRFVSFAVLWGSATLALALIAGHYPMVGYGVAVGVFFTALLLTGRRMAWW